MKKIFTAKKIYCMNETYDEYEAIAINEDKIVGLGTLDELIKKFGYEYDETYSEYYVYPSWVEPHSHIGFSLLFLALCEYVDMLEWDFGKKVYNECLNRKELFENMRKFIERNPRKDDFKFYGWTSMVHGKVTRSDLENLTDKPILLISSSTHTLLTANGMDKKLNLLNQEDSAFIEKDSEGNRTGKYSEQSILPAIKVLFGELEGSIDKGFKRLWYLSKKYGVTTMTEHSQGLNNINDENNIMERFVKDVTNNGLRLVALPWLQNWFKECNEDIGDVFKKLESVQSKYNKETSPNFFYDKWIKVHLDGAIKDQEVKLSKDFNNRDNSGNWNYFSEKHNIDTLIDDLKPLWKDGYSLSFHTQGDGAHDKFIEIFDEMLKVAPKGDKMFRLEHLGFAPDRFFEKLKSYPKGSKPEVSGFTMYNNLYAKAFDDTNVIPEDIRKNLSRFRSVLDSGAMLSLHSDIPNMPTNPLLVAWEAVTRETIGGIHNNFSEDITRREALTAITRNAAIMTKVGDVTGSLEVGKSADINIFDVDLFKCEIDHWKNLPSLQTIFKGIRIKNFE